MMNDFKWRHFRGEMILGCVRWYCKYGISYRELEEMMAERGLAVDHTTIYRWVQSYAPEIEKRLRWYYKPTMGYSWRVDETYMLGGALEWRPMVWVAGDKGTGKSTLQKVVKGVFGRGGLIPAVDASAAGLWQSLGHSSLPVALDEVESEEDNRRNNNLLKLARVAASGGQMLRGGSDHKQASFTVRSCFLFSSILIQSGKNLGKASSGNFRSLEVILLHRDKKRLFSGEI